MTLTTLLILGHALASSDPEPEEPGYGADVSIGYLGGSLLGPWPETGVHGTVIARYDAFRLSAQDRGPRIGASLWGSTTAWPLQHAIEGEEITEDFTYTHAGIMAVVRHDPEASLSGIFGLGFSRLDLVDYWGGPQALPMLSFEAGVRHPLSSRAVVDLLTRAHWSTARSGIDSTALEEWWMVQIGLSLGWRMR
jgi:hypothetical protein